MKNVTSLSKRNNTPVQLSLGTAFRDNIVACAKTQTDKSTQNHLNEEHYYWLQDVFLANCDVQLPPAIRAKLLRSRFRRQTGRLAASLITALKIDPIGHLLVPFCGTGIEADNTEAVLHWVRNLACCPSCLRTLNFTDMQRTFIRFLLDNTGQEYYE